MKRRSQTWEETQAGVQSPLKKLILAIMVKIYTKDFVQFCLIF